MEWPTETATMEYSPCFYTLIRELSTDFCSAEEGQRTGWCLSRRTHASLNSGAQKGHEKAQSLLLKN